MQNQRSARIAGSISSSSSRRMANRHPLMMSPEECCGTLQTVRAFPLLTVFRPVRMRMLLKWRWGFEHPLVAVVDRTVVLGDDFELLVRIVPLADAFDGFLHS